jgi:uncharacterized protein (DUF885 family)
MSTTGSFDSFDDWLDGFFESYYRRRPVNATFVGRHEYDHELPEYTPDAVGEYVAEIDHLRSTLDTFDPDDLSEARAIDHRLAGGALEIQRWELTGDHFHRSNPCLYTGEAIFGVLSLFLTDYAPLEERVAAAISRMEAIPGFLADARETLDETPPWWIDRARRECRGALAFFEDGIDQLATTKGIESPAFRAAGGAAAEAFREYQEFLETDLRERTCEEYGCGPDVLDLIVSRGHCRTESLDEIFEYAQEALADAESYLETHASEFGAESWQEALAQLGEDHPTVEDYYDRHTELWEECRQAAEAAGLVDWPDYPLEFEPRPEWSREVAEDTYFLYYRAPAPEDDIEPVRYLLEPVEPDMDDEVINQRLRQWNDAVIKQNHVAHHGGIGHHFQNYHAQRADSRIGRMAAVDTASRIALVCGGTMAEGWSPYATSLMAETDFYTDLEEYALQNYRLRNAARAIVDVQLHRGQMTAGEASAFYQEHCGMDPGMDLSGAGYEVVKNSMFPGMALMYLLGPDTIRDLRTRLSDELGEDFDLRSFHEDVVSFGSIPTSIVADRLDARYLDGDGT